MLHTFEHETDRMARFLLWPFLDYSSTNAIPCGVCLHWECSKAKRISRLNCFLTSIFFILIIPFAAWLSLWHSSCNLNKIFCFTIYGHGKTKDSKMKCKFKETRTVPLDSSCLQTGDNVTLTRRWCWYPLYIHPSCTPRSAARWPRGEPLAVWALRTPACISYLTRLFKWDLHLAGQHSILPWAQWHG